MKQIDPWYEARDVMYRALADDLVGSSDDDTIDERPLDRFLAGILHPAATEGAAVDLTVEGGETRAADDEVESAGADGAPDPGVALSRMRYPSSMGLTFAVPSDGAHVEVRACADRYQQVSPPSADRARRGAGHDAEVWRRIPVETTVPLSLSSTGPQKHVLADGLTLLVVVRQAIAGHRSVTVVLRNTLTAPVGGRDAFCWFRPALTVTMTEGAFSDRPDAFAPGLSDDDVESYALIYRSVRNLAVGHGCAVEWDEGTSVSELRTTFLPSHDLELNEAASVEGLDLDMSVLAREDGLRPLDVLLDAYGRWIDEQELRIASLDAPLRPAAVRHVESARHCLTRLRNGRAALDDDPLVRRAFGLMNQVMAEQRTRQDSIRSGHVGPPVAGRTQSWRPFQIAFILLNLRGLSSPDEPDREVADLLWFPTGGGKTEAYLGLIAFSVLLRRLRYPSDGGVSVIMRYTLRLLTLQQFERAAGLICALEDLRRRELPSAVPISIGLWVGQAATPNSLADADKALRNLRRSVPVEDQNPVQLLRCPWCGTPLSTDDYVVPRDRSEMRIPCPGRGCEFGGGLPVHVVDDEVYRVRPSLVIATVDKFAMVAWRAEVGALFSSDGLHSRPDLIVQDELHLISGPLGTMVGLYETVVDAAARGAGRPKIVASTATIRRATRQIRAVFDRDAHQFPPQGLDSKDSFFSVRAPSSRVANRRYVGVLAPGTSHATLLVRAYAALLQAGHDLPDGEVKDAYWTLVGYFNSLRVLGSAYLQVLDDVPDRIKVVAERLGRAPRPMAEPHELTSRKKSSEIPEELLALSTPYPDPNSPDVVLATNMISVGVDVDRLGLMVVMGQPQATAEYIQATSRVGRMHPGLVVTLYNGARSRDLSHFENFTTYHRTLYRQVEATSATPFAARARDRGLHGVLVGLVRMTMEEARQDPAARSVEDWLDQVGDRIDDIVARAERVTGEDAAPVRAQLEDLLEQWRDLAESSGPELRYPGWYGRGPALLVDTQTAAKDPDFTFPPAEAPWPTLTSLREVDAESGLYLIPTRRSR